MNYSYHPDAQREVAAAVAYYVTIGPQLGNNFLTELEKSINRILSMPEAWAIHIGDTRRCLLHRFPYGVVYLMVPQGIEIVAVTHLHRKPDYWRDRVTA